MADRTTASLARTVRAAVRRVARPAPDADLLAAFVRSRDPAAFEALVRRHGPLVLAACRAVLPDPADADDACQVAFVVLHRKAHTVRDGRTLGGWLFRVARRAALEVKAASARRRDREARAARPEPVPAPDLSWREACAILHEELDRLPPRYRLPLILCHLEGKTQDEAAAELGVTVDAVRGRVNRGRDRLRKRLDQRGVTLSAALLAAVAIPAGVSGEWARRVVEPLSAPSPAATAAAAVAGSAAKVWPGVSVVAAAAALFAGTVLLDAAGGPTPKPPGTRPGDPAPEPVKRIDALGDPLPAGAVARLGTVRFNHGDGLKALLFTPDGKAVVSVGNGLARVWDAASGAERSQFPTNGSDWDEPAVVTPDGKRLVLVRQQWRDDAVRSFDLATGKEVHAVDLAVKRTEMSVFRRDALSPDGRRAAVHAPDRVRVFDVGTGKELFELPKKGTDVRAVTFAGPDRVVTTDVDRKVEVWDPTTGRAVRSFGNGEPVGLVVATADGRLVATLEHNRDDIDHTKTADVVRLWDVATGRPTRELTDRPGRFFMGVGFSADGRFVQAFSQGRAGRDLIVWDAATGRRVAALAPGFGRATALSPDGKRVAAGDPGGKFDVWDLATGKPVVPAAATAPFVGTVYLSRDGRRATTVGRTAVTTWDVNAGKPVGTATLPDHLYEPPWCRFSPDGRYAHLVLRTDKAGSVVVWDVAAGRAVHTIPYAAPPYATAVAVSPDSTRFAYRIPEKEPAVSVRDAKTGDEVAAFKLPAADEPSKLYFADDGRTLVVTGRRTVGYGLPDGTERFAWTVDPGPGSRPPLGVVMPGALQTDRMGPWRSLVLSAGGTLAAYVVSTGRRPEERRLDRIVLCDAHTGAVARRWGGRPARGYERLTFSPDDRLLAADDGNDVQVWEVATGTLVRTFRGHQNRIETLAFSGTGRRLASASHDSTVLVWELSAPAKGEPADWWNDLASADAATAYASVWRLADAPDDVTIPLLRKHLRPVPAAEAARVGKLIADLDSDEFRTREQAFKELLDLGRAARPALTAAQQKEPSAEAAGRLEQLLAKVVGPPSSGESLRTGRALAVLEAKGTPAAVGLLRELAAGADGWLTIEARAAVKRAER